MDWHTDYFSDTMTSYQLFKKKKDQHMKLRPCNLYLRFKPDTYLICTINIWCWVFLFFRPVRIRFRIHVDPPHPLVCRKRRLHGVVFWMRPEKPRSCVTAGVARLRSRPAQRPWAPSIGLNFAALHRCNEVFWTGLKTDPGDHFSTLNIETSEDEFRP
jgi:hypothetical protein